MSCSLENYYAVLESLSSPQSPVHQRTRALSFRVAQMADSGALNQVRLRQLGDEDTLLVADRKTGLLRALTKPYAYIDSKISLQSGMKLLDVEDARKLSIASDNMGVEYCGFVFQKDCPLKRRLDYV